METPEWRADRRPGGMGVNNTDLTFPNRISRFWAAAAPAEPLVATTSCRGGIRGFGGFLEVIDLQPVGDALDHQVIEAETGLRFHHLGTCSRAR